MCQMGSDDFMAQFPYSRHLSSPVTSSLWILSIRRRRKAHGGVARSPIQPSRVDTGLANMGKWHSFRHRKRPRQKKTPHSDEHSILFDDLRRISRHYHDTLFVFCLAPFLLVFCLLCGQPDWTIHRLFCSKSQVYRLSVTTWSYVGAKILSWRVAPKNLMRKQPAMK